MCDHVHMSTCVTGSIKFFEILFLWQQKQEDILLKFFSFSRQSVKMEGESKPVFRMRCSSKI